MAGPFDLNSLRGKITSAYITLVVSTAVLGIVAIADLLFLESQITEGEVVTDLKDAVLEMRREEKNLFLYANEEALFKADKYAALSMQVLQDYSVILSAITQDADIAAITNNLDIYRVKLGHWNTVSRIDLKQLQDEIRAIGHKIYLAVDTLSAQERRMLAVGVKESQWLLMLSLFVIGASIYAIGRKLNRVAVAPLKQLESQLMQVAKGRFKQLDSPSSDREFITFTKAFNDMLNELEIHQKRMMQTEKLASLGVLSSGVAHELNNPLSNISVSCQLLMEELTEAEPDQLRTWLNQIDQETERGKNIVRALLDFGSQRVFQKRQHKLIDIINNTQIIMGKTSKNYSTQLSINVPQDLSLNVDEQRIQQLLINLVQNAIHAGGASVHIRISAMLCNQGVKVIPGNAEVVGNLDFLTDYDGQFIEILVSDDGPGIKKKHLKNVFDPFFTTSELGHGVGLGLYIVQEIVSEHDGCLAITSQPNEGIQIIILLPHEVANDA